MTATARPLLNEDPRAFAREGYCVYRDLLPRPDIVEARLELDALIAANPGIRPEHLTEPHAKHPYWLRLCRHPRVLEAVRSVLGDELLLIMSHLIVKPARDGQAVAWHQDKPTWPSVHGADIVTVWLAIDDSDAGNGCMNVIANSHGGHRDLEMVPPPPGQSYVFDFQVRVPPELERESRPVELRAGDCSIHDSYLIHGSAANRSERRRAGFTMRYADARTTRIDVAAHWVPVYAVSGSSPPSGYIDAR